MAERDIYIYRDIRCCIHRLMRLEREWGKKGRRQIEWCEGRKEDNGWRQYGKYGDRMGGIRNIKGN